VPCCYDVVLALRMIKCRRQASSKVDPERLVTRRGIHEQNRTSVSFISVDEHKHDNDKSLTSSRKHS